MRVDEELRRMQKQIKALKADRYQIRIFAIVLMLPMLFSVISQVPRAMAQTSTEISIDPSFAALKIGDGLTITVNVANVQGLFGWQVALKYNGTILNCTGVWIPDDDVFAGETVFRPEPLLGVDTHDGLSYIYLGNSLISAPVAVTGGVLFKANFTSVVDGTTTLLIATKSEPVYSTTSSWDIYYTALVDYSINLLPFTAASCSVSSGEVHVKPVAAFSILTPVIDNSTHYVMNGHRPSSGITYVQSYVSYVNVFNASASHTSDPNRTIALYVWNFGDGNVTETTSPVVTHVYSQTGPEVVTLKVADNGNPPDTSDIVSQAIVLGLVLDYVNWMPLLYVVLAIIAIVIVVSVARRIIEHHERQRQSQVL
jgi:hypothetical protein